MKDKLELGHLGARAAAHSTGRLEGRDRERYQWRRSVAIFCVLHNPLSPSHLLQAPRRASLTTRLTRLTILAALPLAACLALASPAYYAPRDDLDTPQDSSPGSMEVPVHKGKEFELASAPPRPVVQQVPSSAGHKSQPLDLDEASTPAAEAVPVEEPISRPLDVGLKDVATSSEAPAVPDMPYKGKLIDPLDPPTAEALESEKAASEADRIAALLSTPAEVASSVEDDDEEEEESAPVHKGKPFAHSTAPLFDFPERPRPHHKGKPKLHYKAANHTEGGRLKGDAQPDRREAVKRAFLLNYEAYEKYAYLSDLLKPIAKVSRG